MEEPIAKPNVIARIDNEIAARKKYIYDTQAHIDRLEKARVLILSNQTVEEIINLLDGLISEEIAAAMAQNQANNQAGQG